MSPDEWKILREVLVQILENQIHIMGTVDTLRGGLCTEKIANTSTMITNLLGDNCD